MGTSDSHSAHETSAGRILIADDDAVLARAFARALKSAGYDVEVAPNGRAALIAFQKSVFDAVVTDISMPEVDGLDVLSGVRNIDPEVPVLLVTGAPTVETAIAAVDRGALRYLVKPVDPADFMTTVAEAVRMGQLARLRRDAAAIVRSTPPSRTALDDLRAAFERALATLYLAYQPIVSVSARSIFGYEALVRTGEASLPHPPALFACAEKLGRVNELSRKIRDVAPRLMLQSAEPFFLFINLHARDLADDMLFSDDAQNDPLAHRIIYEVSERSSIEDIGQYRAHIAKLRARGYRIAVDDLGAGYAGLSSFALLEPEIVKLDMQLVRAVEASPVKQKVIRSLVTLCAEMSVKVVAEGVETVAEAKVLAELGCDLQQGYLYAKPSFPPPKPQF